MELWILIACTLLLSLERIAYYLVWRHPAPFRAYCEQRLGSWWGGPVDVLQKSFYFFKVVQVTVFLFWCAYFGHGWLPLPTAGLPAAVAGGLLIAAGMVLNLCVFYRLGKTGVFYGNKLGYHIPWKQGFPFSPFRHPQYVGAVLSIWGFFLIMRYPHPDWIALPIVETALYTIGARHER